MENSERTEVTLNNIKKRQYKANHLHLNTNGEGSPFTSYAGIFFYCLLSLVFFAILHLLSAIHTVYTK